MTVSASENTSPGGRVAEVTARTMMGASDGFNRRRRGGLGRSAGRSPPAALIAACTSREAASMSRFRSN